MSAKRTGLGRGLDALLGDSVIAAQAVDPSVANDPDNELRLISVDLMRRGTYQPRQDMHQDSLEDLADSIRAQGVIQPIVVRTLPTLDPSGAERYEIIAGERRWRAAQIAGLEKVPVVVRDLGIRPRLPLPLSKIFSVKILTRSRKRWPCAASSRNLT
jgi:ParB family chromosome partitioning protein